MENNVRARVVAEYKGAYKVKKDLADGGQEFLAKVTGKQMFAALSRDDFPAVGDWVLIEELPEAQAVIREILPRKNSIKRKSVGKETIQIIAANIDVAFVVQAVGRDYNLNRFERYFAITADNGIKPAIILNKIDLIPKEELDEKLSEIKKRFPETDVILTSAVGNTGLDQLKNYIEEGKTYCFLGSSGVGKSSLINKLLGKELIKTDDISQYSNRGKHITTGRQMYFLPDGGILIDNPGMRQVGMADATEGIEDVFSQITQLAENCKYKDCAHISEAGCQVLAAVQSGKLDKKKYENYISLKKESEYYEMSEKEKKEKDKDFGKFVKNAKKSLKEHGMRGY